MANETSQRNNQTACTDLSRRSHSSTPPALPRKLRTFTGVTLATVALLSPLLSTNAADARCSKSVYVYSASWCGTCRRLTSYLELSRIRYTLLDANMPNVRAEMRARFGTTAVPQMLIGMNKISGLNTLKIRQFCR